MPIYFKLSMQELPLTIDSIGNRWSQESITRTKGFPLYHWLQTESGQGTVTLAGGDITLNPGEGILIAPHTPHRYRNNTKCWMRAVFSGLDRPDAPFLSGKPSERPGPFCPVLRISDAFFRYLQEAFADRASAVPPVCGADNRKN